MSVREELCLLAEEVDRLAALDARPRGPSRGVVAELQRAARQVVGGPLAMRAAETLRSRVRSGDVVVLLTGCVNPINLPAGETDGPPGAAALARALRAGLGAHPLILVEPEVVPVQTAACRALGLGDRDLDLARQGAPHAVTVSAHPTDPAEAAGFARRILADMRPSAVIAVEKLGPNRLGVIHSAAGVAEWYAGQSTLSELFAAAREAGVLTVGVGDNGNELGMGLIEDAVRRFKPYGDVCQCPCGGGLACALAADLLVVAAVSNWGCYAVEACLAALCGRADLMHDAPSEERMLAATSAAGAADGNTGAFLPTVDGMPTSVQAATVELFRWLVQRSLAV